MTETRVGPKSLKYSLSVLHRKSFPRSIASSLLGPCGSGGWQYGKEDSRSLLPAPSEPQMAGLMEQVHYYLALSLLPPIANINARDR